MTEKNLLVKTDSENSLSRERNESRNRVLKDAAFVGFVKIHERKNAKTGRIEARVIAACDEHLLGQVFRSPNGVELDLEKYRRFYDGEKMTEGEFIEVLSGAENVNLVGENVIAAAGKALGFKRSPTRMIGGVPHLQFYKI